MKACEEEIKESLKSPSSFKLVWSNFDLLPPLTVEEQGRMARSRMECEPNCSSGDKLTLAYTKYIDRMGPKLAARLKKGERLNKAKR